MAWTASGEWTITAATDQEYQDAKDFADWRFGGAQDFTIQHDDANKKVTVSHTHPSWSIAWDGQEWIVTL